jgi:hypothetical protein
VNLVAYATDAAGNSTASFAVALQIQNLVSQTTPLTKKSRGKSKSTSPSPAPSPSPTPTLDTQEPAVSITGVSSGQIIKRSVNVSVNATDNVLVSKVSLSIDGNQVALSNGAVLNYGLAARNLSKGAHTLLAVATDSSGNSSSTSITVNR